MPHAISIADFDYPLPDERVAKYPLPQRDASKLLVFRAGDIHERQFTDLPDELPAGTLLVFNNTRVIHARLHFVLPNDRPLEILCLEPLAPLDYQQNLSANGTVAWKCMVGGNRRWKSGQVQLTIDTPAGAVVLEAHRGERLDGAFAITFRWEHPALSFGELLAHAGVIPLPPYLNRDSEALDKDRYQTIYAAPEGSVAAPTAGLHFTPRVFADLAAKGVRHAFTTLHVGAGTFKPVTADTLQDHDMHSERIFVATALVQQVVDTLAAGQPIVPVGTTSLRTLESLYWLGVRLVDDPLTDTAQFCIDQWEPYRNRPAGLPTALAAMRAVLARMTADGTDTLEGHTQLLIAPGYNSRLVSGLITNFHQPRSTLLLLVAALIGEQWKAVYDYASNHDFRFLSYGDSSLLWKTAVD